MDRISTKKSEYRTPQDVREESYRTAKYIYLVLLAIFVAVILHYMFYDLYLLRGDGSVMSNRRSVTMEYDIKLKDIFIQNGDPVELGQIAFT